MAEKNPLLARLACAAIFLVAGVATLAGFVLLSAPAEFRYEADGFRGYDRSAMKAALSTDGLKKEYGAIAAMGSRAPGQAGHSQCAALIKDAYKSAGLELLEQDISTIHPVRENAAILDESGKPLNLVVWNFMPNQVQPDATPEGGLTGRLVKITERIFEESSSFDGMIALVDLSDAKVAFSPLKYAKAGFAAMVVTHAKGIAELPWASMSDNCLAIPFNFPRVLAGPEIMAQAGKKITLHSRVSYKSLDNRNLLGVLASGRSDVDGALVVPVSYDGWSMLPDNMPASFQALQVAIQLQAIKGLLPHKSELRRDVIFVATGSDYMARNSTNMLLQAIGRYTEVDKRRTEIEAKREENAKSLDLCRKLLGLVEKAEFMVDASATEAMLDGLSNEERVFLAGQQQYAVKRAVFQQAELMLQARIVFEKSGGTNIHTPEGQAFRAAKGIYDKLNNWSSYPTLKLMAAAKEKGATPPDFKGMLLGRFRELASYHEQVDHRLGQDLAINKRFGQYKSIVVVSPFLMPATPDATGKIDGSGKEQISFSCGTDVALSEQAGAFNYLLGNSIQAIGLRGTVQPFYAGQAKHAGVIASSLSALPETVQLWGFMSFPAFSVVSSKNSYAEVCFPMSLPLGERLGTIKGSLDVFGELMLSAAFGHGTFPRAKFNENVRSYRGGVYAQGVGTSVVPNYPMSGALVFNKPPATSDYSICADAKGYYSWLILATNPYGKYAYDMCVTNFPENGWCFSPAAVSYGANGLIQYMKDEGQKSQNIYKSIAIARPTDPINLALFRASPVALLDRVNPQSLQDYADAAFLRKRGLSSFEYQAGYRSKDGFMEFIPPEQTFFVTLKAGTVENPSANVIRAFILNTPEGFNGDPEKEIDGLGFLAQSTPLIRDPASEIARSMNFLNKKRLALQSRYGIADEMTTEFQKKSGDFIAGVEPSMPLSERLRVSAKAVVYSTLNHPIIRRNITEAICGVLWYMGLLVPFVFFFEKLLFGYTDIRKQLVAEGAIFLAAFLLLQNLHPAFEMIRSSMIILLGFIIMLISGGTTVLLSGKFRENLEALQKSRGQVKGAQGNTIGVVVTAFMLGLNNMHKRKVRTGLTCATLVLITFVMICFTSVQSNIVDKNTAIGKAAYQGFLVKNERLDPLSASEAGALSSRYGNRFIVSLRRMCVGVWSYGTRECRNPEIEVQYGTGETAVVAQAKSALTFNYNEPLRSRIELLGGASWFTEQQTLLRKGPYPIMLPDKLAEKLKITPELVKAGGVQVKIAGELYDVWAIFKSESLQAMRDLDGDNLLPFDVSGMATPTLKGDKVLASPVDPRLSADGMLIGLEAHFNTASTIKSGTVPAEMRLASVSVEMRNPKTGDVLAYKPAREEIDSYLEQSGKPTFYGLDRISFQGQRTRQRSMTGLLDMLIPLIIAALTVLNTMKGSVYERKDEIFVYNAVGIAPRYVFFMFMAEALVYVVVGAMLGYIISQGTGKVLTAMGWTGGLNMNFASLSTVYVSLTIAVAVLLSTIFPALSAKKIAEPAEESGWHLPEPEGDRLSFELPFAFGHRDRVAVLAFFQKYLAEHGEGSSGAFFASPFAMGVAGGEKGLIPGLSGTVWLKPYDLGVSQRFDIELVPDVHSGEFISRISLTRLSGTRESWQRLNTPFVALIRRHFLHWRAATEDMKQSLFVEAKEMLGKGIASGEAAHG